MVTPEDEFVKKDCQLNLDREDDPASGELHLTEGGHLSVEFPEGYVTPFSGLDKTWRKIDGETVEGIDITLDMVSVSRIQNSSLTEISPHQVIISQDEDIATTPDVAVTVDFDVVCFIPQIPPRNQIDTETREAIKRSEDGPDRHDVDMPDEFKIRYVEAEDLDMWGLPLIDTTDRRDIIKGQRQPLRTAKIRVKQQKAGSLSHQVDTAKESARKILELSQLVQETGPRIIRGRVTAIGGEGVEETSAYCQTLYPGETANVSGAFSQFPQKVLWADFDEYISQAYQNYTSHVRDNLHLKQVLGYYVDARDPDRPIEGRLLSACSAIELLALWHAREDEISEKTASKIEHLVNKLDVETDDLARQMVPDLSVLDTPEYFWGRSRNYVVHGDPTVEWQELEAAYELVLVLLKRLVRNQLLGAENDSFNKFYSMSRRSRIEFDD